MQASVWGGEMRAKLLTLGALLAAAGWTGVRVQQRLINRLLPAAANEKPVRGVFHVHSAQSHDSRLSVDDIARVAAAQELDFVVLTDHNTQSAGPILRHGVIILSYAELSTAFGHAIQFGATDVLAKSERQGVDIHERVRALGGRSILAHPDDRKRDWSGPIEGAGGVEIANTASAARRRGGPLFIGLVPAALAWKFRPDLALIQTYDRDRRALRRWDGELNPQFAGVCGVDAHGRIPLSDNLRLWRMVLTDLSRAELQQATDLSDPEEQDLERGSRRLVQEILSGRFSCVAGIVAEAPHFDFHGVTAGGSRVAPGSVVDDLAEILVSGPQSDGSPPTMVLLRNGEEVLRSQDIGLRYADPSPGVYRVEVRLPLPEVVFGHRAVPVIYSGRLRVVAKGSVEPPGEQSGAAQAVEAGDAPQLEHNL